MNIDIAVDINEPPLIIAFYAKLLAYQTQVSNETRCESARTYFSLTGPAGTKPTLKFQVVPQEPPSNNRIHLDSHVDDIEVTATRFPAGAWPSSFVALTSTNSGAFVFTLLTVHVVCVVVLHLPTTLPPAAAFHTFVW